VSISGGSDTEMVQPWIVAILALAGSIFVFLTFAIPYHAEGNARDAMLRDLGQLAVPFNATLDGRPTDDAGQLVLLLKGTRFLLAHHSSPQKPIHVWITDGKIVINLLLARDSQKVDEYWVLRPGRNLLGESYDQEAGRIVDSRLTRYLQARGF
jgi:hypothetical protein